MYVASVINLAAWISLGSQSTAAASGASLPDEPCSIKALQSWNDAEKWVWERVCGGNVADLKEQAGDGRDLPVADADLWDERRLLTPEFLESVLFQNPWAAAVPRQGVRIKGAWFQEKIDISGGRFENTLGLDDSRLMGANLPEFEGHRLTFDGSFFVRANKESGGLMLDSAKIAGDLSMRGAVLRELSLDRAKIGGDVSVEDARVQDLGMVGIQVNGNLSLDSAEIGSEDCRLDCGVDMTSSDIGGHLSLNSATLHAPAILEDVDIGGSVSMIRAGGPPTFNQKVSLAGSNIRGQLVTRATFAELSLYGAKIGRRLVVLGTFHQIDARSVQVGGDLQAGGTFYQIDARNAKVEGDFFFDHAVLVRVDLSGVTVHGALNLESVRTWIASDGERSNLILSNASVGMLKGVLEHDAWPRRVDLDGFEYDLLDLPNGGKQDNAVADVDQVASPAEAQADGPGDGGEHCGGMWYECWLSRSQSYSPQPYVQLANVLRGMGHADESNDVLYAGRERAREELLEKEHYSGWLGASLLKITIGYGYGGRYFLSVVWVLFFVLLGTAWLRLSRQHPIVDQDGDRIGFFYSLDLLLPIIELRKSHYDIDLHGSVRYYFYFHKMMGYVLASFLIAGLSGLTT